MRHVFVLTKKKRIRIRIKGKISEIIILRNSNGNNLFFMEKENNKKKAPKNCNEQILNRFFSLFFFERRWRSDWNWFRPRSLFSLSQKKKNISFFFRRIYWKFIPLHWKQIVYRWAPSFTFHPNVRNRNFFPFFPLFLLLLLFLFCVWL